MLIDVILRIHPSLPCEFCVCSADSGKSYSPAISVSKDLYKF
jgi:TATA-binding protein-associated factor Taf7